jgi:hypothetical protein
LSEEILRPDHQYRSRSAETQEPEDVSAVQPPLVSPTGICGRPERRWFMADALDKGAAEVTQEDPNGRRLIDDCVVAYRLGRNAARVEAGLRASSIFGRVPQYDRAVRARFG